jgi:hypothetical protein
LNSVKPQERTIANSIANLSYNLFGYLPSPFVYGFVCEMTGGEKSRYGIAVLMFTTILSCFFGVCALFYNTIANGKKRMRHYSKRLSSKMIEGAYLDENDKEQDLLGKFEKASYHSPEGSSESSVSNS